jgi:hypothetical protein
MRKQLLLSIFLILAGLSVSNLVSAESLREYHQRQCHNGDKDSCKRAEAMLYGEQHADRIVELGDKFAGTLNRTIREEDNKPLLNSAYLDVLDDYFMAEAEKGINRTISKDTVKFCAEHFHDHWRNQKMIWPTNDAGQPDWSSIYFYIVEHYYGYCLRSI